jgi:glycosyltransferase involved in cell wall biosynthesis
MVFGSGGGVAENVLQLATGLSARGYDVELAGPPESPAYPSLAGGEVAIHRLPFRAGLRSPGADVVALAGLVRLLRAGGYDLVHAHSGKAGALGRIGAALTSVPAVYSPHSFPFVGDFPAARRAATKGIERLLAPVARKIICVCEEERRVALRHRVAGPDRLEVVYHGCAPCPRDGHRDERLMALREGGPLAAAVAGLRRQKRLEVFLEAAPLVLARLPTARLALVGNGPERDRLAARARSLGLDRDERFALLPFEGPMARYLRTIDVYVLPSGWEALPIGVLEAQACGVPQVATDVGGTREAVVADTGVLVPPRDPAALACAITDLLADGERRAVLGENSRRRHARHFRLDRMVAETAAVYGRALASAG